MTAITADQIAVICPTKDQPKKVERLLDCLVASDLEPAQVLIADGGHNLKPVTAPYENLLNLRCLYCPDPGQILQRNYAHRHLDPGIKLVMHLDDDITFPPGTLGKMLDYWNANAATGDKPLAGASFNLMDVAAVRNSIFRKMMFLSTEPRGHVSKAGYAAPFCPATTTHDVEWLLGGATVWRRDIIDSHRHPMSFPTRWAVCEDLMFSYPLRTSHRMAVVHDAEMFHNDTYRQMSFRQGMFYGVSSVIMRYHFTRQHSALSSLAFIWMTLGVLAGQLARGLMGSRRHLGLFTGGMEGLLRAVGNRLSNGDSTPLAKSLARRKR
ncbi:MAG: glycosyltransferase family 2 protein [Alphaproteobacteria bacterium]|nr:glycosyltransferase family 2 protein [Alphaproteobacteria bacterium]